MATTLADVFLDEGYFSHGNVYTAYLQLRQQGNRYWTRIIPQEQTGNPGGGWHSLGTIYLELNGEYVRSKNVPASNSWVWTDENYSINQLNVWLRAVMVTDKGWTAATPSIPIS